MYKSSRKSRAGIVLLIGGKDKLHKSPRVPRKHKISKSLCTNYIFFVMSPINKNCILYVNCWQCNNYIQCSLF